MHCQFCGRECSTASGLTNHQKVCQARKKYVADTPEGAYETSRKGYPVNDEGARETKPKPMDLGLGAFLVLDDHVACMLQVDFAVTLGEYLLSQSVTNPAIRAFAHKLQRLAE